ncbi:MAG TPA: peptidylprolyl isomerase [Burkholderiales bacterium]|nr:peptidylprolyl isomerase [Betaproteobacteria bacterium]HQR52113.1 peptidylprolyl isomerase [Burkholderiales bacterium]
MIDQACGGAVRWYSYALLLLLAVLGVSAAVAATETRPGRRVLTLDRIVAVVNDEVITEHELQDRYDLVIRQLGQQGTPLPPKDVLEKQLLERMINDRVQLQYARETGIRVDDVQLERALSRIAQDSGLTLQQFRDTLEREGIAFNQFREEIRSEILLARLKEREVDSKLVVSDSEIDNFLSTSDAQLGKGDEYNISHILVLVPEQASPEQLQRQRARAEDALAQLRGGASFGQIAASFSDAPDALQGGSLGWRSPARLPAIFVEAVQSMNPGDLSPVLRSPNGFHIVKLVDRRSAGGPVMIQQSRVRHILIKTNELVSQRDARDRLVKLKERIDNGADFAEMARLHSDDGSASRGGELGWISPGDTVPDFEQAMNALQIGQVSDPVQTPFGFHLIQVQERRTEDMSKERQRLVAKQALRQRKAEEAYQEWVRQLRDRAYVEYRIEDR